MIFSIEDFRDDDFETMLKILKRGFETNRYGYTKEQIKSAEELLLEHLASRPARVAKYSGIIRAGTALGGNGMLHMHDCTPLGIEASVALIRDVEESARSNGTIELNYYILFNSEKNYARPLLSQGYETADKFYTLNEESRDPGKRLTVSWLRKTLA